MVMEPMIMVLQLCRVATAAALIRSTKGAVTATGGRLLSTVVQMYGIENCTMAVLVWAGTSAIGRTDSLLGVSRTIDLFVYASKWRKDFACAL